MPARPTFRRTRTTLVLAIGLLLALVGLAVPTASAHPTHHRHGHHAHGGYLALGDSVPFGYRPPEQVPTPDFLDASSFVGYPSYVAHRLRLRLSNPSCPGETTESFTTPGAQSNGCENSLTSPVGYRTAYPLHVAYPGTQLSYALHYLRTHRHTRLVTLMIGANDLFVCQQTTTDQCSGADFPAAVARIGSNVDGILAALRRHYHHRLVVVTYYSLDYGDPVGTAAIAAIDGALSQAAAAHHAVVADGFGAFERAAAASGGDACAAGLLVALPDGTCNIHPSAKGHHVLARAVLRAVRHHRR